MMLRAVAYFAIVFTVGFALGILRVLWLVPLVGARWAELLEMPLMLVAVFYAARFVTSRFPAQRQADLAMSGGLALILLLVVELSVVLELRRVSISEYFEDRDPVAGTVYLFMLVVFATMPWVVGRKDVAT